MALIAWAAVEDSERLAGASAREQAWIPPVEWELAEECLRRDAGLRIQQSEPRPGMP